jgi:recombination protein RecT
MTERAYELILKGKDKVAAALPHQVRPERFLQIAYAACKQTDLSRCSPESVASAIFACARLGLMPDPVLGHVYIIPYGNVATVIPGYRGLIDLARRGGLTSVGSYLVRDGDEFDFWIDSDGPQIKHRPRFSENPVTHAYCRATMASGERQIEVMTIKEINAIAKDTPVWRKHRDEMIRKCPIRRAAKLWPMTAELAQAIQWDYQADNGDKQTIETTATVVERPSLADLDPPASSPESVANFISSMADQLPGGEA